MTGTTEGPDAAEPIRRGSDSTLSSALAKLDDGCCVLVTGDVSEEAYRVASSRYFGAPHRRRRRVLALTTGGAASPEAWLPDGVDAADDGAAVVRLDGTVRDPAAAAGSDATGSGSDAASSGPDAAAPSAFESEAETTETPNADTDSGAGPDRLDLDGTVSDHKTVSDDGATDGEAATVRTTLLDAIDEVDEDRSNRLGLRVGVFRVDMLWATLGSEATGQLLREVSRTTRDRGGMAHFHLPRPTDGDPRSDPIVSEFVELLDDDLDVIVELRCRESAPTPEERWHIVGWGTTEWNALR
ncbi:DUF7504 family protein [Halobaculum magnesiiphilum]|uniref:Uncharacterized protein n=1 Tax=Halobaculum magnesiiphilum TaxID=1017351 RepID=A0A8T8WE65_9EURY|nr:hypothetical protein [Halobaculum magnesiiphilum]QZP38167.1 hypothetical protein K6T50_03110 [Halobaculum magnesiiphilum]